MTHYELFFFSLFGLKKRQLRNPFKCLSALKHAFCAFPTLFDPFRTTRFELLSDYLNV